MKRTIQTVSILFFTLLLAASLRVDAQPGTWRVVSSTTDAAGTLTIIEQADDGRTRTTTRRFLRSKPDAVESENFETKDAAGNKTGMVYGRWNLDRRQISWGEEFYDAAGYTNKGKRWHYEEENGRIIEPRINEQFNPRTKKWERIGPDFQGVFRNKFGQIYGIRIDGGQVKIAGANQIGDSNKFVWADQQNDNFRPGKTKQTDRGFDTTVWSACGDEEGKRSAAIDRPAKLIFADNGWTFEIVIRDGDCVDGKPFVGSGWVKLNDLPFFGDKFYRVSDMPPAESR